MTKQALEIALEALETLMIERESIYDKAITAIKELLAQPEQEPGAFIDEQGTLRYYKPSDFNQCEYGGLVRLYKEKT